MHTFVILVEFFLRSNIGENTVYEFEDILNESETDADRWAAFLRLKSARRPQNAPQLLLGGYDISFDIDVDLIKRSAESTQTVNTKEVPINVQNLIIESQPQPEVPRLYDANENVLLRRSLSVSPARRNSLASCTSPRASPKSIPNRIRCVDIKRLSQRQSNGNCTFDASIHNFVSL